jgi:hypothetical protein
MKKEAIFLAILFIIVLAIASFAFFKNSPKNIAVEKKENTFYKGIYSVYYKKAGTDKWILLGQNENTLTDIGKEKIEQQLVAPQAASAANELKYIAITNVSGACTSTSTNIQEITTGGLERALCTYTDLGNGRWSCEHTFTASASHPNVQIAGYFWNATAGNDGSLFACGSFTPVNLEANDQILVRFNISISEA